MRARALTRQWLGAFAAFLLAAVPSANDALAAQSEAELVCFVSYANPYQAANDDDLSIARASVMPRETAIPLVTEYSKMYVYPDLATTVRACQCLHNPAPANSLRERDEVRAKCPKPMRIDTH